MRIMWVKPIEKALGDALSNLVDLARTAAPLEENDGEADEVAERLLRDDMLEILDLLIAQVIGAQGKERGSRQ